ncbi:aspartate-semialdehyde dehydrogenase [Paraburkholderia flava]|uniref:aspartate-semialdehyde dehydrogenase n=1 Tax=Paraburkholderia flava TaxID=2547393 RepID=UPI00105E8922|nr:aspartate-semialdehyde dehydrogenase [Paraburkholderia flava]
MNGSIDPVDILEALIAQCRESDYAGYDPFDGLNSGLFRYSGLGRLPVASIAWLQLHKRSPINLRGLIGVPRQRNPKGIALIILGLLQREQRTRDGMSLKEAEELGEWLLEQRTDRAVWRYSAWGYHFDWAARAFFVPKGTPNAITTCYVARALHALGRATNDLRFTDAAVDAGLFLDSLYLGDETAGYYAYIPGETAFVHNASLWTAALVSETARHTGDTRMRRRALTAASQSVSMQRADGSWFYGLRAHHAFVDGFHTGYNLEALSFVQAAQETAQFESAINRGLAYYRREFFLPDGTVKYYNNRTWPLDTHSVAQALITLLTVADEEEDRQLARQVLQRAIETLYMPGKQRFMYQRHSLFANRINYLRWTQAWAFYAIGVYTNRVGTRADN